MEAQKVRVLQLNKEDAVALTDTGAFVRIKKREGMKVGQGIYMTHHDIVRSKSSLSWVVNMAKVVAFSAVLILLIVSNSLSPMTYAIISVDINPSLQLSVDEDFYVIKVEGKNDDGRALLEHYKLIRGDNASDVISDLIALASDLKYIDEETSEILIGAALTQDVVRSKTKTLEKQTEKELADEVIQEVLDHVDYSKVGSHTLDIQSVTAPSKNLESAHDASVTIGDYERTHHKEEVKSYAKIENGKAMKHTDEPNEDQEMNDQPNDNSNDNSNDKSKDKSNDKSKDKPKDESNDDTHNDSKDDSNDDSNDDSKDDSNDDSQDDANDNWNDNSHNDSNDDSSDDSKDNWNDNSHDDSKDDSKDDKGHGRPNKDRRK